MQRAKLLNIIDPFKRNPEFATKTDKELVDILAAMHDGIYQFKFEDYTYNKSSDIIGGILVKQQELYAKEKELEVKEENLKKFEQLLKTSFSNNKQLFKGKNEEIKDEPYIRSPDKVKRETLIPQNIDSEIEEVLRVSAEEHYKKQAEIEQKKRELIEKEKNEYEEAMRISTAEIFAKSPAKKLIKSTDELDLSIFTDKPEDITDEFLVEFYTLLKSKDFDKARLKMNTLSIPSIQWITKLSYGKLTLRKGLINKDNDTYKCLLNS